MKTGNIPETYADVLTLAKAAQSVVYYRALGQDAKTAELTLQLDNYETDRRTCVSVRMGSAKAGHVDVNTLCGYDRKSHRWQTYCAPSYALDLPDRRGQKALLAWIAERSQELTGFSGSPQWSLFRPAPISAVSHAMQTALTY